MSVYLLICLFITIHILFIYLLRNFLLRTLGTVQQLMALRPEKGTSAVNNRMTEAIKDKYGVKRYVRRNSIFDIGYNFDHL